MFSAPITSKLILFFKKKDKEETLILFFLENACFSFLSMCIFKTIDALSKEDFQ